MEPKTYEIVDSVEKLEEAILRTKEAQKIFQLTHRNRLTRFSSQQHPRQIKQESALQSLPLKKPAWV